MNDDNKTGDVDDKPADSIGPQAGERLAQARRDQQISVVEVAKELHLDEQKVRALEQNSFEILGAPVFAKGHLRKYAQLVGVDIKDVLAEYYALNRTSTMPPVVGRTIRKERQASPGPWIVALLLLLAAAAAYWWFVVRQPASVSPAVQTAPSEPAPQPVPDAEDAPADPALIDRSDTLAAVAASGSGDTGGAEGDSAADTLDNSVAEVEAAATTGVAAADDGAATLTVQFVGDCWTEVSDATGRRLFFDLGRTGRTINLRGDPPFAVVFGDADNVEVRIDGTPYAIVPADRNGRMARLSIGAN